MQVNHIEVKQNNFTNFVYKKKKEKVFTNLSIKCFHSTSSGVWKGINDCQLDETVGVSDRFLD